MATACISKAEQRRSGAARNYKPDMDMDMQQTAGK
jgi:hypothetical protein